MDGFVEPGDSIQPMGHWTDAVLPFAYSLARTFCLANRWFCSAPCQTCPNRRFLMAGTACEDIATDTQSLEDALPSERHDSDRPRRRAAGSRGLAAAGCQRPRRWARRRRPAVAVHRAGHDQRDAVQPLLVAGQLGDAVRRGSSGRRRHRAGDVRLISSPPRWADPGSQLGTNPGSTSSIAAPRPFCESCTPTVPLWASAIARTIARPRPAPALLVRVRPLSVR